MALINSALVGGRNGMGATGAPEMGEQDAERMAGGETDDLTPEQEESYDRFTLAAQKMLYEDGMAEDVGRRLTGADDVTREMASIAYELVSGLDERSGGMLEEELIAPAAMDILGMVAEIGRAAKVEISGEAIAGAATLMITRYLRESGASDDDIAAMTQNVDLGAAGAQIDSQMGA